MADTGRTGLVAPIPAGPAGPAGLSRGAQRFVAPYTPARTKPTSTAVLTSGDSTATDSTAPDLSTYSTRKVNYRDHSRSGDVHPGMDRVGPPPGQDDLSEYVTPEI